MVPVVKTSRKKNVFVVVVVLFFFRVFFFEKKIGAQANNQEARKGTRTSFPEGWAKSCNSIVLFVASDLENFGIFPKNR